MERVIERVKLSKLVNQVVVASPHDLEIVLNVPVFTGDEQNVLRRYYDCADFFGADIVVRITSDCPLIDPKIIDFAITYRERSRLPYVIIAPADGLDVEVFTNDLLKEAYLNAKSQEDKEHVTPYMKRLTKCSIDTMDDLEKVRGIYGLGQ